jgi:hypothetical protein
MIAPKARLEPGIDTGRGHGTVLAQPRQEVLQGETFRKDGAGHLTASRLPRRAGGEAQLELPQRLLIHRAGDGDASFLLILAQRRLGLGI